MKFGVLGCRHFHIAEAVAEMQKLGHMCVGVCEPDGPLAARLAEQFGLERLESRDTLLARGAEMILCSSINSEKIGVVELCAEKGLHIMIDKPAVTTLAGYKRLESVMKAGHIQVGMMLTERFSPVVWTLRQQLASGALGRLVGVDFDKPHKLNASTREGWHFDKTQNGGPIIDLLIHDFDLLRWLSGSEIAETAAVMKVGENPDYPQLYDDARVLARCENGVTSVLHSDWWTPAAFPHFGNLRIVATGTLGRCEVYGTGEPALGAAACVVYSSGTVESAVLPVQTPPAGLMEDFLARIDGREHLVRAEDILKATLATLRADAAATVINLAR